MLFKFCFQKEPFALILTFFVFDVNFVLILRLVFSIKKVFGSNNFQRIKTILVKDKVSFYFHWTQLNNNNNKVISLFN